MLFLKPFHPHLSKKLSVLSTTLLMASSSPSDYRPISLLPIVSKVLERHVYNFLSDFCTHNHLISNSQFGFRSGFSTVSALLSVTHDWFTLLDSHSSVCAVFFDLRKAFDSVPHQLLLNTLSSSGYPSSSISLAS